MAMRYKCVCQYDGREFFGWQRQPRVRTVQLEIEKVLQGVYGVQIAIHGASRTDKGVHATEQVFHYDTDILIPFDKLKGILNRQLPADIAISDVESVTEDFHSRFSCIGKTYIYKLDMLNTKSVFNASYVYLYGNQIDLDLVRNIAQCFIGTHDFKGFMASGSDKENTIRTIYSIDFSISGSCLEMRISGSGFLYNMVRIIIGTLINVSEGKLTIAEVKRGLTSGNRQVFKRTAPACGLYLVETRYV